MDQDQYRTTAGDWILGGSILSRAFADRDAVEIYGGPTADGERRRHGARDFVLSLCVGGHSGRARA